ncbi:MAG: GrpB family protein [Pseudonocardiaceae bacterium]
MPFADEQARRLAIAAYDPTWPSEFCSLAVRIGAILAPVAEHIDHVGSTAVPGLAAKDCIDIQIRVPRLNEEMIAPPFAELGFRLRPEPWNHIEITAGRQWPKLVFAPPVGERAANVHVRETSSATARRNLLFRDFLRADRTARHAWTTFKQRLAQVVTNLADYGQLKQAPTEILMIAAEDWARRTKWTPPAAPAEIYSDAHAAQFGP